MFSHYSVTLFWPLYILIRGILAFKILHNSLFLKIFFLYVLFWIVSVNYTHIYVYKSSWAHHRCSFWKVIESWALQLKVPWPGKPHLLPWLFTLPSLCLLGTIRKIIFLHRHLPPCFLLPWSQRSKNWDHV